jgi:hypothetical protein
LIVVAAPPPLVQSVEPVNTRAVKVNVSVVLVEKTARARAVTLPGATGLMVPLSEADDFINEEEVTSSKQKRINPIVE